MKKRLIFVMLLLVALLIGVFAVNALATEETTPALNINAANLSFEDSVHILYSVEAENLADTSNLRLLIWRGEDVHIDDCTKGTETHVLTPVGTVNEDGIEGTVFKFRGLSAAQMTENVYARAYIEIDGVEYYSSVKKYSVLQYAYNKLGKADTDTELVDMLNAMLDYGATAQKLFDTNEHRLANADFYEISVDGATLPDGTAKGLYATGEEITLTASATADKPYVAWSDAAGNVVGKGESFVYTVGTESVALTPIPVETEPELGTTVVKQEWDEDGELKILAIGNSYARNTLGWFPSIAAKEGVSKITVGVLYIGGCDLDTHAANATGDTAAYTYYHYTYDSSTGSINTNVSQEDKYTTTADYKISTALREENWDFVTIQQASALSGVASSYSSLDTLIDTVSTACPRAKLVWNMTWSYADSYTGEAFATYNNDRRTMYEAIVSATESEILTNSAIDIVVPLGTAIENARILVGTEITSDGTHLSWAAGCYVAALTEYCTLLDVSAADVTHTSTHPYNDYSGQTGATLTSAEFNAAVRQAVSLAQATPYEALPVPEVEVESKWDDDSTLNVLVLGDTKSAQTLEWFAAIARAEGVGAMTVAYANNSGTTIADHTANLASDEAVYTYGYLTKSASDGVSTTSTASFTTATGKKMSEILADKAWDFVVIQQEIWSTTSSGSYSTLSTLASGIATACPKAKIAFSMMFMPATSIAYTTMASAVSNQVAGLEEIDMIIPLATAVENTEISLGVEIVTSINLNWGVGRYVAALSIYSVLLDVDPTTVTHAPNNSYTGYTSLGGTLTSAEYFAAIRSAVKSAINSPYSTVTPSSE